MNKLNHWLRSNFGISKSEANGILILLPLLFLAIISPSIYSNWHLQQNKMDYQNESLDSLVAAWRENFHIDSVNREQQRNYNFYSKSNKEYKSSKNEAYQKKFKPNYTENYSKKPTITKFDLNTADTTTLKQIRGIGPTLSARIVKYRELLGGFTHKNQLKEVYGLKDSVLLALDTLTFLNQQQELALIAINILNEYELSKHPYIDKKLAKAIVNYRYQHGAIQQAADLYKMHLIDSLKVKRLVPYLNFNTD